MSPDYLPVQGCWRKPPPLPNFFQVSSKFLRLLKPLTNSDKSISLKFSDFANNNERLHKLKCKSHPFEGFYGCKSPWSFQEERMSGGIPSTYAHNSPQLLIYSFAHLLASSRFRWPGNMKSCQKPVPG